MKRVYSTANGKQVNLDALIAQNENTIAVGNMKVNARGDQLGPGGRVEKTKDKVMSDYYKLNTPVAVDNPAQARKKETQKDLIDDWIEPPVQEKLIVNEELPPIASEDKLKLRGKLANSVAKKTD